jgi:S1-C subfamily serine protease
MVCNNNATIIGDSVGMEPWAANLIGLALGFAVGGAALGVVLGPHLDPGLPSTASAPPSSPAPSVAEAGPALPVLRPVELPRFAPPAAQADPLPNVVHPEPPSSGTHAPGQGMAGTGFFVASDGSLLTAAHVVSGCGQIRIASKWVKPAEAQMVATDNGQDIALLRAPHVTPPAMLPIGRPAGAGGRLFVLGYPASGGPLIPTETWAVLENAQFQPAPAELVDPRRVIWVSAPAVGHGFSGGPMLDPRNGDVVGIVRGMVDSSRLHAVRASIPASGMVIGPGSSPLAAMLRQEAGGGDALAAYGDSAVDAARRATVHVLCLY